jgi:processive 1,2-diacylglycerol beta-glucosyltransferase
MAQRILVLSASVGAGHLRAAEAVTLAMRELAPEASVENLDVLDFTNATFRTLYGRFYLDLVNRAPHVWGYFYDLLDRAPSPEQKADRFRIMVEKLNLRKLLKMLRKQNWDLVVSTHYLPAGLIASLRQKGEVHLPQFTVSTDFETHRLWVNQPCEHYFTATEEGAVNLQHWGVPSGDITVAGIPIHPAFRRRKQRDECLRNQGLAGDRPVVLQLAGGFGVGPVEGIFQNLLGIEQPLELVAVAGRNEELLSRLQQIPVPDRHRAKVLGYTTGMDELMTAADVLISKPGGLTTSEALACGAAMVVVNPIPGQESRNSDFLLENGAAVKINNLSTLTYKLHRLLSEPAHLARLKENALRLAKPDAAFTVARAALDWRGLSEQRAS